MTDYYEVLDLDRAAGFIDIERAYERLKVVYRSDELALARLTEAYRTLSNPMTRGRYDRTLAQSPLPPSSPRDPSAAAPSSPRRPSTEVIDLERIADPRPKPELPVGPSPAPRPPRPSTEIIDLDPPPAPRPMPDPASGRAQRPATEVMETMVGPNPGRVPRPGTEVIEVSPGIGDAPPPPAVSAASAAVPTGGRKREMTEYVDVGGETMAPSPPRSDRAVPVGAINIIVQDLNNAHAEFPLGDGRHILGRPSKTGAPPAIELKDRFVSREHAVIIKENGSLLVADNNSVNGTRLNGERLDPTRQYPLTDGDVLEIEGFKLTVVFPPETG